MSDQIVRGITADGYAKVIGITSKGIVERARQIHKTLPMATAALGRTLTAASMMGNMMKEEKGSVTLQIRGGGPLGKILAVSDCHGNVRGYLDNPQVSLMEKYPGKMDIGAAVGKDGTLTVIRDLNMKEPYIGSIPLVSGEIAEDITNYYVQSEQIPTACALGVLVDRDQSVRAAGGYMIQMLPGAPDSVITAIENSIRAVGNVSAVLDAGADARELLEMLFVGTELRILETDPVSYRCYCSRDRVSAALVSLGEKELNEIIADGKTETVSCQFCDTVYSFTPQDLRELLFEAKKKD